MPVSRLRPKSSVTAVDVARRAGVSIATVSRVLHRTVNVSEEVTARVLEAVTELGYVPHAAARNLAQGRTATLGLLLPEIGLGFFSPMLRGIESAARQAGYDLLIATHYGDDPRPPDGERGEAQQVAGPELRRRERLVPLGPHNTDGLLIFADNADVAEMERSHRRGFPVVLLYRSAPEGLPIPYVTIENQAGARQAVDHLIEAHGRRRIAFLRGPAANEDAYWRERGYRESLATHGIPFDPALVADGEFQEERARVEVERRLAEGLELDAIFAADDDSAGGALIALAQAGKRVPQDVALVGFDDTLVSRYLSPPLTTVHAPTELVGREAMRQLVRLITTGEAEPVTLLPTRLVIRQSCGCP
jgi:LacI family transcriptional regulator